MYLQSRKEKVKVIKLVTYLPCIERDSLDHMGIPIVQIDSEEHDDCLIYNHFDTEIKVKNFEVSSLSSFTEYSACPPCRRF